MRHSHLVRSEGRTRISRASAGAHAHSSSAGRTRAGAGMRQRQAVAVQQARAGPGAWQRTMPSPSSRGRARLHGASLPPPCQATPWHVTSMCRWTPMSPAQAHLEQVGWPAQPAPSAGWPAEFVPGKIAGKLGVPSLALPLYGRRFTTVLAGQPACTSWPAWKVDTFLPFRLFSFVFVFFLS